MELCSFMHFNVEDHEKIAFLLSLLSKFAYYKSLQKVRGRTKKLSTRGRFSIYVPRYLSPYSITSNPAPSDMFSPKIHLLATSPKSRSNIFTIDQYLLIQSIFNKLYENYEKTVWTRNKIEKEISVAVIKQFWLDSYGYNQYFFHLICEPISNKVWVNSECFKKCFEEIRSGWGWNIFSSKRSMKHNKSKFTVQKSLCNNLLSFFLCCQV